MNSAKQALVLAAFFAFGTTAMATVQQQTADYYHVTYTTKKGKAKCCTKKSKMKADECAERLRSKQATNVNVMAGRCPGK
jgi:hypothetical protein